MTTPSQENLRRAADAAGISHVICKRCDQAKPLDEIRLLTKVCFDCKPLPQEAPLDERTTSVSVRTISTATETSRRRH